MGHTEGATGHIVHSLCGGWSTLISDDSICSNASLRRWQSTEIFLKQTKRASLNTQAWKRAIYRVHTYTLSTPMRKSDERTIVSINQLANSCAHTVTILFLRDEPKHIRWRYHRICIITTCNGNNCGSQRKWQCLSSIINKEQHKFWTQSESVRVIFEKTGQLGKM